VIKFSEGLFVSSLKYRAQKPPKSPQLARTLRPRDSFTSAPAYYSTLFHELTHSTGHTSRLNRHAVADRVARFGSEDYSQEELCAEMGACFLASECGLLHQEIEQSAAYINGWLNALKRDKKMVVVAASQAEKAANYILGRDHREVD
jgi:antirestriction protein ArdC